MEGVRAGASWPLVGREAELSVVERALRDPGGAVVAGAAGVGKTRLLREAEAIVGEGSHVERAVASRSAASLPLGAFAHLLSGTGATDNPLGAVRAELVQRSGGASLLLVVDDAHTLDPASAALRLAAADSAPDVIATAAGIEVESVPAFVELARVKLEELERR